MKNGMLELKDAPMFGRVMRDKEICKETLRRILGFEIEDIEYLNTEQELNPAIEAKGVRLDVYARGSGKVYDIEMQRTSRNDLHRRMRYYQASMDADALDAGEDYGSLPTSYVIFICEEDPFGGGVPAYHIDRMCAEMPVLAGCDDAHWLVLNAAAWAQDADKQRASLLKCIHEGAFAETSADPYLRHLAEAVRRANEDAAWRGKAMGFMTLEHSHRAELRFARQEGYGEGHAEGEARANRLAAELLAQDRLDELKRSLTDETLRQELYREFGI